jgi:hypothetical protein
LGRGALVLLESLSVVSSDESESRSATSPAQTVRTTRKTEEYGRRKKEGGRNEGSGKKKEEEFTRMLTEHRPGQTTRCSGRDKQ